MALSSAGPVVAGQARCFTTDDGMFPCQFRQTDRQGSFTLSAPGKPSLSLTMTGPGVASGTLTFGQHPVFIGGHYRRSAADPACWVNDSTHAKVCAW